MISSYSPTFLTMVLEQNAGPQNWENFLRKQVHLFLTLNMGIASFLLSKTVNLKEIGNSL